MSRRGPAPRPPAFTAGATPRKLTPTIKRVIWTGAFAAVTFVGAIYGAGLKTQQEYKAVWFFFCLLAI